MMKWNKLIGITLMSSAVLLQVGYATTLTETHPIVNTGAFEVYFGEPTVTSSTKYVDVTVQAKDNILEVDVANLYPGATFGIQTHIKNNGEIGAVVKSIRLIVNEGQHIKDKTYNTNLMNMLIGYDEQGQMYRGEKAYADYLTTHYTDQIIEQGEVIPLVFEMGMNPEEEGLVNQVVQFQIAIELEQANRVNTGGNTGSSNNSDEVIVPEEAIPEGEVSLLEEEIPGGEVILPEEAIPGGEVILPEEAIPGGEMTLPEEDVPGGALLPQTGGVMPVIVYTIGFTLLTGGIVLYRRKEDEEWED